MFVWFEKHVLLSCLSLSLSGSGYLFKKGKKNTPNQARNYSSWLDFSFRYFRCLFSSRSSACVCVCVWNTSNRFSSFLHSIYLFDLNSSFVVFFLSLIDLLSSLMFGCVSFSFFLSWTDPFGLSVIQLCFFLCLLLFLFLGTLLH